MGKQYNKVEKRRRRKAYLVRRRQREQEEKKGEGKPAKVAEKSE